MNKHDGQNPPKPKDGFFYYYLINKDKMIEDEGIKAGFACKNEAKARWDNSDENARKDYLKLVDED